MNCLQRNYEILQRYKTGESQADLAREFQLSRERVRVICNNVYIMDYPFRELINLGASSQIAINICRIFKREGIQSCEQLARLSQSDIELLEGAGYRSKAMIYIAILHDAAIRDTIAMQAQS